MAIRNGTVLAVEQLEVRDTPTVIGALGGGNAAVILQTLTIGTGDNQQIIFQLVTPGHVFTPVDPCLPGLLRAVAGAARAA